MSKAPEGVDDELAKLQVPSHSLPNDAPDKKPTSTAKASNAQRLRGRIKPYPIGRSTPGYQVVLNDIERRRGRELRRTFRAAEAARKKQQYRYLALAVLVVLALGLAVVLLTRWRG